MFKLALACSVLLLQACAPLLKSQIKVVDIDIPQHYQSPQETLDNAAEMHWDEFFSDPQLIALIDEALEHNQEVKIALAQINRADSEVLERKGEYYPFVTLKSSAELEKVGRFTRNGAVEESLEIREDEKFPDPLPNFMLGLFATWELDVWGRIQNSRDVAIFEYMASMEGQKFVVTNLVAEISNTYYELMALDNKLKNMQENIQLQQDVLKIVKVLKQAARSNELAVKRFEAEVQKNQSELYNLRQEIAVTENKLNYLVGRMPQKIKRDSVHFKDLKPQVMRTGIPSQLLRNRPDILRAEHELEARDLNVEVAKAKFYPSFGMKAGVGYQAFNPLYLGQLPQSLTYSASFDMSMPLVNRNAIQAEYQNASAQQVQAAYEYERSILNAYREVANQLSKMNNLDSNFKLKNQQVKSLEQSISISKQLFKSARADYMEVLLTQREALEAKLELIETRREQMSAMVDLYRALGGGWKEKLVINPSPPRAMP